MLQRIQTVFLLLVAILTALLFFTPLESITISDTVYKITLNPFHKDKSVNSLIYLPMVVNAFVLLLTLITIFTFKNRKLQMKLCVAIALLSLALMSSVLSLTFIKIDENNVYSVNYSLTAFLPLLNILLAHVAKKFIRSDEELVRSADRIR